MKTARHWILPLICFLFILFLIGSAFVNYARYNSKDQVEKNLIDIVSERAEKMSDQLLKMTSAADLVCLYLKNDLSTGNQQKAADVLKESTGSYLVVICGASGRGIGSGKITVDISSTDYYKKMQTSQDVSFFQFASRYFLFPAITCSITSGPGAPRVIRFSTQVFMLIAS